MREPSAGHLGAEKFVALTTFKRNGDGVSTPLWIVRDEDELLVWTPADSWKVKRVQRDPSVTLVACSRMGKTVAGATPVAGRAQLVTDPTVVARVEDMMRRKYGLGFRVMTSLERIIARGRKDRVVLTIRLDED